MHESTHRDAENYSPNSLIVLKFSLNSSDIKLFQLKWSTPMLDMITLLQIHTENQISIFFCCNCFIMRVSDWDTCVTTSSFISGEGFFHHCVWKEMQIKCSNILRPFRQVASRSHRLVVSGLLEFDDKLESTVLVFLSVTGLLSDVYVFDILSM